MLPIDKKLLKTKSEPIRVIVRCRPMSSNEQQSGYSKIVNVLPSNRTVQVHDSSTDKATRFFEFDAVYDTISSQEDLYSESVLNIIDSVMRGYNATIFAYGQTGSGKTFTMEGSKDCSNLKGIIPRSFEQIFSHVNRSPDCDFSVIASYVEIYNEEVRDLLNYNKSRQLCKLREDTETGVFVKNLSRSICKSVRDLEKVMRIGNQNRQTGFTHMNEHSSRSHAILTITVEARRFDAKKIRTGKLNLVDLAGSERQSKTNSTDERLKEASKINLSLSALGNVISALGKKQRHIPYRDSKLTRLLQDSLGGNSRTLMIANIGPASYNYEETLMTLRYANRAKRITNRPSVNESDKDSMIKICEDEIRRLKCMIAEKKKRARKALGDSEQDLGSAFINGYHEEGDCTFNIQIKDRFSNEDNNRIYSNEFCNDRVESIENILNETYTINDTGNLLNSLDEINLNNKQINQDLLKIERKKNTKSQGGNFDNWDVSSKYLMNHIAHLNEISEANRTELEKAAEVELELKQKISKQEKNNEELATLKRRLQKKVDLEKCLLKEYQNKLKCTKLRTQEIMDEFNTDRRSLNEIREELLKACRLNKLIMENFVPPDKVISFESIDGDYGSILRNHTMEMNKSQGLLLEDILSRNYDWYRENEVLYLQPIDYNAESNSYLTYYASRPLLKKMLITMENEVENHNSVTENIRNTIIEESMITSHTKPINRIYPKARGLVPR